MDHVDDAQRRVRLARRHRLAPAYRADDVATVAQDLVALHCSDPATPYLSVCARLVEPSLAAVDRALHADRAVVRHHAMRRTLWAMVPAVARQAHACSTRKVAAAERRKACGLLDVDDAWLDDAITRCVEVVAMHGPSTTRQVGERLPDLAAKVCVRPGTKWEADVARHTRVLLLAGFEGRLVRGASASWISAGYAWELPWAWELDALAQADTREAAAALLRRWLVAAGPLTELDATWWTGWTKTQTSRALADVGAVVVGLDDGGTGYVLADDRDEVAPVDPWVALLPGLDPTPMGWKERGWYLPDDVAARVTDRNGNIGPTVWVDGEVVGGWVQRPDGAIASDLRRPLGRVHRELLDGELARVRAVLGQDRFRVRFPSPNQTDLLT